MDYPNVISLCYKIDKDIFFKIYKHMFWPYGFMKIKKQSILIT